MSIIWPTLEEVRTSIDGYNSGGCIPGKTENLWEGQAKELLEPFFCRWSSDETRQSVKTDPWGRRCVMPHIKTFLRHSGNDIAWIFISSFNLSGAAWGRNEKNDTQLHIMSYEMGILLLPSLQTKALAFSCTPMLISNHQNWRDSMGQTCGNVTKQVERHGGMQLRMVAGGIGDIKRKMIDDGLLPLPIPYCLSPCRYKKGIDIPWASDHGFVI